MRIQSPYRDNVAPIDSRVHHEFNPGIDSAPGHDAESIGALLVARGVILPGHAEQIAQAQRSSGQRFGATAVTLGLASQDAVDAALASQFNFSVAAPGASQLDPSLITARGQRDRASELVRSLRTNLSHVLGDWPGDMMPAVTVASMTAAVGRRLIASNLAIASAQAGVRTLLVDADMRQPALHLLFNVADSAGLSSTLAGRHSRAPLHAIESIPGLSFLPGGPIPPNPAELLARLAVVLPTLREQSGAEFILLNAPPLDVAEDLYVIAAAAPAVLMVTRRHFTLARPLAVAAKRLQLAGATIVGSILNVG
jgi:capsular exopolysaccharide synthesis family protein